MNNRALCVLAVTWASLVFTGCWADREGPSLPERAAFARAALARGAASRPGADDGGDERAGGLGEAPTLGDYLTHAALNNPGTEAAFNRWKAALERIPQVRALPDPRFTYLYFIEQVETRVGAQRQSVALAQTFPWFGKLALRGDAAAEAAEAERERFEAAKLALDYRVTDAYYEYYYLGRAIAIMAENVRLMSYFESVARARYRAAAGSHPDVIRAEVELGTLDDRLRSLRDLRGPIVARLNAALNRPTDAPLPWPTVDPEQQFSLGTNERVLLAQLAESNPQLLAMDHEAAGQRHQVALAGKAYYPDVTVGVTYIDTADSTAGRRPPDDGQDPVVGMLSVNLPIWRDKYAAGVRQAKARRRAVRLARTNKTNALTAQLKLTLYRYRDAERKIDLYRDTLLPKARRSIKASKASFGAGKARFLDLIDAQRMALAFELAHQRAWADRAQRLAEIEMLVGRPVPRVRIDRKGPSDPGEGQPGPATRPAGNLPPGGDVKQEDNRTDMKENAP